jgi:hypothetical protein
MRGALRQERQPATLVSIGFCRGYRFGAETRPESEKQFDPAWVSSRPESDFWIRRPTTAPTSRAATRLGPPASRADPGRAATAVDPRPNRRETIDTSPRQPNPGFPAPHAALIEAPPCTCDTSELRSERRGRLDSVPSITFPDRIEDHEVANEPGTARRDRPLFWRPG